MVSGVGDLVAGHVVADRYRLVRLVGQGGFGVVWQATHTTTGGTVALKFLRADDGVAATRRRLVREARAAAAVSHPNVRAVFDVLELDDGAPVLVMEYLDGESLAERLQRGPLSVEDTCAVLVHVCSGVGAAHAAGVVHRDLKPHNIFLIGGALDAVKVVDFGIARTRAALGLDGATRETQSGALVGTPQYMSPEQVFGDRDIDHRSDVWSLGLVAHECLTGLLPTRAENVGQVMKIIVSGALPRLRERCPDAPPDLDDLVAAMLSRAAPDRPASLQEVVDVLQRHTHVRAPAIPAPSRVVTPDADAPTSTPQPLAGATTQIELDHVNTPAVEAAPRAVDGASTVRRVAAVAATLVIGTGVALWLTASPTASTDAAPQPSTGPREAPTITAPTTTEPTTEPLVSAAPPMPSATASVTAHAATSPRPRTPPSATPKVSASPSTFSPSTNFE